MNFYAKLKNSIIRRRKNRKKFAIKNTIHTTKREEGVSSNETHPQNSLSIKDSPLFFQDSATISQTICYDFQVIDSRLQ